LPPAPGGRAALALVALVLATAGIAPLSPAPLALAAEAAPEILRDFMTQNVCLDARGDVVVGRSPLDNADCARQRDLRPSEPLPYHKHDHPAPAQSAAAPAGYQRHDSFPVETAGLGTIVEHSFDFGAGEGRRFGVFDLGSDGGDIVVLSPGGASIAATEDGGGGFGLWVGECAGVVTAASLAHSWIIAEAEPPRGAVLEGETIARLNGVKRGQDACPARFNRAYTTWRVIPFAYRAAPGQGAPVTLTTFVSEHYGGAEPATADHVERFYFTRELGGTRWERWQNAAGNRDYGATMIAGRAAEFAASGRCSEAPAPAGGAKWLLIDCREWTRIASPSDPAGDPPGFFLKAIRQRPDAPELFAAPAAAR